MQINVSSARRRQLVIPAQMSAANRSERTHALILCKRTTSSKVVVSANHGQHLAGVLFIDHPMKNSALPRDRRIANDALDCGYRYCARHFGMQ
jgi:hypothetical protein